MVYSTCEQGRVLGRLKAGLFIPHSLFTPPVVYPTFLFVSPSRTRLSGFFFPQGFMTSVKQTHSRDFKIAVDTLRIGS